MTHVKFFTAFALMVATGTAFAADLSGVYSKIAGIQSALAHDPQAYSAGDVRAMENYLDQALRVATSPTGGGSEITNACVDGFGNGSSGSRCAQNAHDAAAVRACVAGFGNGSSGLDCAENARSGSVVSSCVSGFGNGSSGLSCAKNGHDGDAVQACVSGFGNGSSGLTCAQAARDGGAVRACVARFGNGSSGLQCAVGN